MVAVLKSLVEEEPFHSSSLIDAESETSSSPMANFLLVFKIISVFVLYIHISLKISHHLRIY